MEPISDLDRLRRTLAGTFAVPARTVTTDHRHLRTVAQPGRQIPAVAPVEQIDWPAGLQIDQHSAVTATSPEGEVIHTQRTYRLRVRVGQASNQSQQRIPANRHTQRGRQPRPTATSQRQPDARDQLPKQRRVPAVRDGQPNNLLGERTTRAAVLATDKPADLQPDHHRRTRHRSVPHDPPVAPVYPVRLHSTART
jgi:hypothetical protein